jgi:type VI secretion system protein ImpH
MSVAIEIPKHEEDVVPPAVAGMLATPARVGFYRAIELLERSTPEAIRIGGEGPPGREGIRFRHDPSMSFSSSDVSNVRMLRRKAAEVAHGASPEPYYEVTTTFLGLTGTVSPMPAYFAEDVVHEDVDHPAQRDFLDVFHHRVLSLFYRAHSKYSFVTDHTKDARDPWSRRALCLAGFDGFGDQLPMGLSVPYLLRLAPLLARRARTADGLVAVLSDVLKKTLKGAPVDIDQFVGRWVSIEERQLLRLGIANTTLGEDATVGRKVYDRGGKFRVVLGPMKRQAFEDLQPGKPGLELLREVVSLYVRDPLEFDVELILAPGEAPSMRLGTPNKDASKLGRDSWLTVGADREVHMIVQVPQATNSAAASHEGSEAQNNT